MYTAIADHIPTFTLYAALADAVAASWGIGGGSNTRLKYIKATIPGKQEDRSNKASLLICCDTLFRPVRWPTCSLLYMPQPLT
jgi:hypothetical protein